MEASAAAPGTPPQVQERPARQRVARNAGIYLAVQLVSWGVTFVALSIIPRRLGEHQNGELVLASSTVGIVFTVGAMCIDEYLVREIGRDADRAISLVRATLGLRLCLTPALLGACYVALRLINASPSVMALGLLAIPGMFLVSLGNPLRSILAGREQAREVSLSDLWLTSSPLMAIPFLGYGGASLLWTRMATLLIGIFQKLYWLRSTVSLRPLFDLALWKELLRGSTPFLLNGYVGLFNGYLAMLVLNHFLRESAVGEFNQASRLIGTFLVVPTVLAAALLPQLTRMAGMDAKTFAQAKLRIMTTVIVSCLPVMVGVILLAEPLCHVLYKHQYVNVPYTLQIGALQLLPLYVIITGLQFLVAQNRNAVWSAVLAGMLAVNVSLAWALIPRMGGMPGGGVAGAMLANVIAEYAAMIAAFVLMGLNPLSPAILNRVARGLLAAGAMGAVIVLSRNYLASLPLPFTLSSVLQLVVPAVLGSVVFLGLAGLLRAFPPEEQALVVDALRRKLRRGPAQEPAPARAPVLVLVDVAEPETVRTDTQLAEALQLEAQVLEMRRLILRYAAACSDADAHARPHTRESLTVRAEIQATVEEEKAASDALCQLARQLQSDDPGC